MSPAVAYLPEAEDDIIAAHETYEGQRDGLGDRFIEALCAIIDEIRNNAQGFGVVRRNIRAATVRRFPYVVYYRERGSDILVIAVQHGRRSARRWQERLH